MKNMNIIHLVQVTQSCPDVCLWWGSDGMSGLADYSHMTVSRNCGGSHTVNVASQRRQAAKLCAHTEADLTMQVGPRNQTMVLLRSWLLSDQLFREQLCRDRPIREQLQLQTPFTVLRV